ncbi:hypothetical protein FO519_004239 [Halicephalobus sp. NKZ332]|nr:hypothetical protein FO519_004239 [Halicephalobus sp. NKZ332]
MKKKATPRPPSPDAVSVMRTLQPRRPLVETWKCIRKPCKKTTEPPITAPQKPVTLKPKTSSQKKKSRGSGKLVNPKVVKSVSRSKVTPRPQQPKTFATVKGIRLESVKPYTFRPRQRTGPKATSPSTIPSTSSSTPPSARKEKPDEPTTTSTTSTLAPEFPYSLLWPDFMRLFRKSLPIQVVLRRVFQMVQYHLTHAAWEFEELQRVTDPENTGTPRPLDLDIFGLGTSTTPVPESPEEKIERMIKSKKPKGGLKKYGSSEEVPVEGNEDRESEERKSEKVEKTKNPNAELIAAIKDVVRKFKNSLERSGVHEDVRHMGSQLETTWNDLRRGMQRSWQAFRQSAEGAILSPMTVSPPPTVEGYPYIITRQASPPVKEDEVKEEEKVLSNSGGPLTQFLFQNLVFEPDDSDSGKFDQWIERAHQMLADSVNDSQGALKTESQPIQVPREKVSKPENQKIKNHPVQ